MSIPWIHALDTRILTWMNAGRSKSLDLFFTGVTWLGSLAVLAPLTGIACLLLWRWGRKQEVLLITVGLAGASLIVHAVKWLFGRPRPDIYAPLITMPGGGSFPSAHTAQAVAFFLCLGMMAWRGLPASAAWAAAILGFAVCLVVGISRIYLQVHYASDVLAGAVIAVLWGLAADAAIRFFQERPIP